MAFFNYRSLIALLGSAGKIQTYLCTESHALWTPSLPQGVLMSSDETRDMSLAFSTTGQFLWWYFYHGAVTFVAFIECDVLKALKIIILSLQKNFYIRLWLTSGDGTTLCLHQEVN